jgi:hypothetical protein
MKTHERFHIHRVDVHAALARAHADRAEYVRTATAAVPTLVKRLSARLRPNRRHPPQTGALNRA